MSLWSAKPALQNALTLWKIALKAAKSCVRHKGKSSTAPTASMASVPATMSFSVREITPSRSWLTISLIPSAWRTPKARRPSTTNSVPKIMIPSPPSWMRPSTTAWPKSDRSVAVSTTVRPVTQVALVAVNRASSNHRGRCPVGTARGSISRPAPTRIRNRKLPTSSRAGAMPLLAAKLVSSTPRMARFSMM